MGHLVSFTGCAYRFGYASRKLPRDAQKIAIPMFENLTSEVGVENYFTSGLREAFARSQVAQIADTEDAPVVAEGSINSIVYRPEALVRGRFRRSQLNPTTGDIPTLPDQTSLATRYRVFVTSTLRLRKSGSSEILWESTFTRERYYEAPRVGSEIINTVNPLYNHSARLQILKTISTEMMAEAHDRMTENF